MKQITLEVGSVFGRLTVIGNCMSSRFSAAICRCECGTVKTIRRHSLTKEHKPTRSCGCLALEAARVALRCDRGSSFESPEAAAAHRKQWKKTYAKQYDARPEQREKRNRQKKEWLAAMTPQERERQLALRKKASAKPERMEKKKLADKSYQENPANKERIKDYLKAYTQKSKVELSDGYVAACFLQGSNLKKKDLPSVVIDVVRASMQLRRSIKEKTNEKRN